MIGIQRQKVVIEGETVRFRGWRHGWRSVRFPEVTAITDFREVSGKGELRGSDGQVLALPGKVAFADRVVSELRRNEQTWSPDA